MSIRFLICLYLGAVVLQAGAINLVSLSGITPNIVLCLTVVIIFMYRVGYKVIPWALASAIIVDICLAQYYGVGALALFLVCVLTIEARRVLNNERILPMVTTAIVATFGYNLIYWIIMKILGNPMGIFLMMKFQILNIFYNVVVMGLMFFIVKKSQEKIERERRRVDEE